MLDLIGLYSTPLRTWQKQRDESPYGASVYVGVLDNGFHPRSAYAVPDWPPRPA